MTEAAADSFPAGLPKTVSLDFHSSMVRWACGTLELSLGDQVASVPVMVPTKSKLIVGLEFNERCFPEVRVENNRADAVNAR
ncbi:MAG: hypothetical protein V2A58_14730, partial [Planctomycetota bacterium]